MRFIHTGDIHIDSDFHGSINPRTGLNRAWESNRDALASAVEAAVALKLSAFIISGDLFKNGRPSTEAVLMIFEALLPLVEAGIPIIILGGNHDSTLVASNHRTPTVLLAELLSRQGGEVHVVERDPRLVTTTTGMQVVCVPWLSKATLLTSSSEENLDPAAGDRLVVDRALSAIEDMVNQSDTGSPLVFASHVTVDDVRLDVAPGRRGSEVQMAHLFAEPVIPRAALEQFGFAYGALSHIHARQQVGKGNLWYAGAPNRFTVADADKPKSVNLVTITAGQTAVAHIPTQARPMRTIDLSDPSAYQQIEEMDPGVMLDVTLEPGQPVVPAEALAMIGKVGGRVINTRHVAVATDDAPAPVAALPERIDPVTALRSWLTERDVSGVDRIMDVAADVIEEDA